MSEHPLDRLARKVRRPFIASLVLTAPLASIALTYCVYVVSTKVNVTLGLGISILFILAGLGIVALADHQKENQ